ncbi:unnamed protein product, partial [Pylaiella littoralis]
VAVDALADVGVACPRAYSSRAVSSVIPGVEACYGRHTGDRQPRLRPLWK